MFFYLWPTESKRILEGDPPETKRMRYAMLAVTILHCLGFALALAMVGFWPMLYNGILAAWAYSCYLTIREKEILVYFILLIGSFILTMLRFGSGSSTSTTEALGSIQSLCTVLLLILMGLCGWIAGMYEY